jgi:hypothetical protein
MFEARLNVQPRLNVQTETECTNQIVVAFDILESSSKRLLPNVGPTSVLSNPFISKLINGCETWCR